MMEELDDDIIQMGLDAQQQALSLVQKAITATTTHEKNKLIDEMRHVWRLQENCANQLSHCNAKMSENLAKLKDKEGNSINNFQTLDTNTSFIAHYQQRPPTLDDKSELIKKIQETEEEIKKFGTLSAPNLLEQVSNLSNDYGLLKLRDVNFKRLEELAYTLKKRSFHVDDSEDLSLQINQEYGSINGLLEKYEELRTENLKLRAEEISFFNDQFVKRRNLSAVTLSTVSNMAVELQNMLDVQHNIGKGFPITHNVETSNESFDDMCNNSSDLAFSETEFPTNIKPESIENIVNASDTNSQIDALKVIIKEQEETINQLLEELEPLRQKQFSSNIEFFSMREEKMWQQLEKSVSKIQDLQGQINNTNDLCYNLHKSILTATNQNNSFGEFYGDCLHKYIALIEDDTILRNLETNNFQIANSLSKASLGLGINQMYKDREENGPYTEFFKKYMIPPPSPPKEPEIKIEPPSTPESPRTSSKKRRRLKRRSSIAPRKRKSLSIEKEVEPEQPPPEEPEVPKPPPNPIENATKEQVLDYLALTYDITSKLHGEDTTFHHAVSGKLHYALQTLRNQLFEETRFYECDMRSTLSSLQVSQDFILRKPKVEAEVSCEMQPRTENEAQVIESEFPPKTKGGRGGKRGARSGAKAARKAK